LKLTDTKVKNAKPKAKAYRLADGRGFYVLVTPGAAKLFRWKYRYYGSEKLMAFGKYPDVSLEKARKRCQDARELLADNIDPMARRKVEKQVQRQQVQHTFRHVAKQWHEHWKQGQSERHAAYVWSRLEKDILPRIGSRPVAEIESLETVNMLRAIADRGVADLSKRAYQVTSSVFRYAVIHKLAEHNPVASFKPKDVLPKTEKQNYARVDAKELPKLLHAIDAYAGEQTRLAMQLLAHTFVRTSELINAKWSEFDIEHRRWDIPPERMKMKRMHTIPLSKQALSILARLKELAGTSEYVFAGLKRNQPMSNGTILMALKRMGYQGRMTGHGFRGVASTILNEQGYESKYIEAQLAHQKRNQVEAAYNHAKYLPQRIGMMQAWSDYLDKLRQRTVSLVV